LDNHYIYLLNVVLSADAKPPDGSYELFEALKPKLTTLLSQLQDIFDKDLTTFNNLIREKNIPAVIVPMKDTKK